MLYDQASRKSFEVPKASLEGKSPTCIAFLFRGGVHAPGGLPAVDALMTSPLLAVGCSDGFVRLVHLATLRVRVRGGLGGGGLGVESCLLKCGGSCGGSCEYPCFCSC